MTTQSVLSEDVSENLAVMKSVFTQSPGTQDNCPDIVCSSDNEAQTVFDFPVLHQLSQ